jgi:uncharacterized repeat protein (TIGR03803 family)
MDQMNRNLRWLVLSGWLGLWPGCPGTAQSIVTLHSFTPLGETNRDGALPLGGLVLASNLLYGTTGEGGSGGNGVVFSVSSDGSDFVPLHSFAALSKNSAGTLTNSDGAFPTGTLVLSDGTLYGTASAGGAYGNGTVFTAQSGGSSFTVLHDFTGVFADSSGLSTNRDGAKPSAGLTLSGNLLFGTTPEGGRFGNGTVFRLNRDGTGFQVLHHFTATSPDSSVVLTNGDGSRPHSSLVLSGNTLFGTTSSAGGGGQGTVFSLSADGTAFTTLHSFTAISGNPSSSTNYDGASPMGGLLLQGPTLYGTASAGGEWGEGTVFAVHLDGTDFTTLHSFSAIRYEAEPSAWRGGYGGYPGPGGGGPSIPLNADGANPKAGLVASGDTLYGTASAGGASDQGTIFALKMDGTDFTTLHTFTGSGYDFPLFANPDGATPVAELVVSGGTLYGSTSTGGTWATGNLLRLPRPAELEAQFGYTTNQGTASVVAFYGSDSAVTVPNTLGGLPVTSVASDAFNGSVNLGSVTIPSSVTNIGERAFFACTSLGTVAISNGVIVLGASAFEDCRSLISVDLGTNLTRIGTNAFASCSSLSSITIPSSVTNIGAQAFASCASLTNIDVDASNPIYSSLDGVLFDKTQTTLLQYPGGKDRRYAIPPTVTLVGDNSFHSSTLTSITIPPSVVSLGDSAFADTSNLTEVFCEGNAPSSNGNAFDGDAHFTVYYVPGATGFGEAFAGAPTFFWDPKSLIGYTTNNGAATIARYFGTLATSILPDQVDGVPITSIADAAFNGSSMTSVTIPDSVTQIGTNAFANCAALTSLNLGTGISTISDGTFQNCTSLSNLSIPPSVTNIGVGAFQGCSALTSLSIPDSVITIRSNAFANCTGLTNITLGKGIAFLGQSAFGACVNVRGIYFRGNAPTLEAYVFKGDYDAIIFYLAGTTGWVTPLEGTPTRLWDSSTATISTTEIFGSGGIMITGYSGTDRSVILPSTLEGQPVTTIGNRACLGANMTNLIIPDSVISIGPEAFSSCSNLVTVSLGQSVAKIAANAFESCPNLITFVVSPFNTNFSSADGALIDARHATLLQCPQAKTSYTVSDQITNIAGNAFSDCVRLTNVIFGDNVAGIGNDAFQSCSQLVSLVIPDSVVSIGSDAFGGCGALTNVTLGNGLVTLGGMAFYDCPHLAHVSIGNSLLHIGQDAFGWCTNLSAFSVAPLNPNYRSLDGVLLNSDQTTVVMCPLAKTRFIVPNHVTRIGTNAFAGCVRLTNVVIGGRVALIDAAAFGGCLGLTNVTMPDSVLAIGHQAFEGCTNLITVSIGNGLTTLGSSAFYLCLNLADVRIGTSLASIGADAFTWCTNLTALTVGSLNPNYSTVDGALLDKTRTTLVLCPEGKTSCVIPNGVVRIETNAFYNCLNLTNVTIPDSVQTISDGAFAGSALTRLAIPGSVNTIGTGAFWFCHSLTDVTIPGSGATRIGDNAFYGCSGLTNLVLGNGVQSIGNRSFYVCTSLANVTFGQGLQTLGDSAFQGASALTSISLPQSVASLGHDVFAWCVQLTNIYFGGNAPSVRSYTVSPPPATVYYLPNTTGWGTSFAGLPTLFWRPQIESNAASFGVQKQSFGFTVSWTNGMVIVIEASPSLPGTNWVPLQTNTLTSSLFHFSDSQWTNFPLRYYRVRSP